MGRGLSARAGVGKFARERVARRLQIVDHAFPVGGARGHGDRAAARGEPLDLLQLYPVPGRIPDHGVEPAVQPYAVPRRPDAGKRHLPVQEMFLGDELLCLVQ